MRVCLQFSHFLAIHCNRKNDESRHLVKWDLGHQIQILRLSWLVEIFSVIAIAWLGRVKLKSAENLTCEQWTSKFNDGADLTLTDTWSRALPRRVFRVPPHPDIANNWFISSQDRFWKLDLALLNHGCQSWCLVKQNFYIKDEQANTKQSSVPSHAQTKFIKIIS